MSEGAATGESEVRVQRVLARLKERGCRMTPQRAAVVRALVESTAHPSADQVHDSLLADYPMLSLATVYKTVELLKELAEVVEVVSDHSGTHYEGRRLDEHPHILCRRCGRIADVPLTQPDLPVQRVAEITGYAEVRQRLCFVGVCPVCQAGE